MKLLKLVVTLVLFAAASFAADVDGKWSGTFHTDMGDFPVAYTLQADGAKLTGTTTGPDGAEVKIADGKIDGDKISFNVTFDFGGMPFTMGYQGVVSKTEIKFTVDIFGMPMTLAVKKGS